VRLAVAVVAVLVIGIALLLAAAAAPVAAPWLALVRQDVALATDGRRGPDA